MNSYPIIFNDVIGPVMRGPSSGLSITNAAKKIEAMLKEVPGKFFKSC